jgi:alpha-beta hydrolase superfamily lysophospholipase
LSPLGLGAGAVVLLGLVLALDRFANHVVSPAYRPFERTVPELGLPHEDLSIPSGDHDLAAWLVKPAGVEPDEVLYLIAHGWGANYSTVLRLAEPLANRGHEVLLFDVRGHGRSEPVPYVTIRHFRDDVMAAARWVARRYPERRIVLIGHSLGGAGGVLAVADGAPVDGLVLIAAPSDVLRVTAEFLTDKGLPGDLLVTILRPFFWRRVGSSFRGLTPSRRIAEVDVPVLIIQPENDARVYRAHAERLSAARGEPYRLVEGYEHTDILEAPETMELIEEFLERL